MNGLLVSRILPVPITTTAHHHHHLDAHSIPSHLPWRRSTAVQGHCPDLNVEPKINYATHDCIVLFE